MASAGGSAASFMPVSEAAALRHRLAQLDYTDPFSPDSARLIERLLADLVLTTDSMRKFKQQAERAQRDKAALEEQVHLDLIKMADERDSRERRAVQLARRTEAETAELRFTVAQYSMQLEQEQNRGQVERQRVEEAFAKMGMFSTGATSKTKSKKTKEFKLFEKLQKIDIETGLVMDRPAGAIRDEGAPIDPAESIHQLPIARQRIQQLEYQIDCLQEHIDMLEKERGGVHEERDAIERGFNGQLQGLREELEGERQKSAGLLRTMSRLEKMVSELNALNEVGEKEANGLQMGEMQDHVEILTEDRDNLSNLYKQPREEPRPVSVSDAFIQTDEVEVRPDSGLEANILKARIAELELEIARLQGDMKAIMYRQREVGASATETIRQVEVERDSLQDSVQRQAQKISQLQDTNIDLENSMQTLKGEVAFHENVADELKRRLAMTDMDLEKEVVDDRDKLKTELSECENQIAYLNEIIRSKDQEKDHLVSSYRKLIADNDRLDITMKTSGEEISSLRVEIITRDKHIMQTQKALDDALSENSKLQQEKTRLLREVGAVRDLAQTIDKGREDCQRELAALTIESDRLQKLLVKAESDREALREELHVAHLKYERLEQMIASERSRAMQHERSTQSLLMTKSSAEQFGAQQSTALAAATKELAHIRSELEQSRGE
ncbi:hypothetical protein HK405_005560, partial [Cladochytrium tenue]